MQESVTAWRELKRMVPWVYGSALLRGPGPLAGRRGVLEDRRRRKED
jgi:hypothetical protein